MSVERFSHCSNKDFGVGNVKQNKKYKTFNEKVKCLNNNFNEVTFIL